MKKLWKIITGQNTFNLKSQGNSMLPTLYSNDFVYIDKKNNSKIIIDDIVMVGSKKSLFVHRLIYKKKDGSILTKGDNNTKPDDKLKFENIVGKIYAFKRKNVLHNINSVYLHQSSVYIQEITRFVKEFNKNKIDYVFLRGWPYHLLNRKRYPLRIYADCEILIDSAYLNRVNEIFSKYDYINRSRRSTRVVFNKSFGDFVITFYVQIGCNILLDQYGVMGKLFPYTPIDKIYQLFLNEKEHINYQSNLYPVLSYPNLIVYLCLYFFHYNFRELYRLRIIDESIRIMPNKERMKIFNKLSEIIIKFNIQNLLYPTFILLKKYYDCKIPPGFLIKIAPSRKKIEYIHKIITNLDVAESELRITAAINRFKNLFFLSPLSTHRRLLVFFNFHLINEIFWLIKDRIDISMSISARIKR